MKKENDILKDCRELKENPFTVPEGYFESFKTEARKPMVRKVNFMDRIAPYAAVAAMFVFLVTVGTLFLDNTTTEYEMTEEDYVLFSDSMMNSLAYEGRDCCRSWTSRSSNHCYQHGWPWYGH